MGSARAPTRTEGEAVLNLFRRALADGIGLMGSDGERARTGRRSCILAARHGSARAPTRAKEEAILGNLLGSGTAGAAGMEFHCAAAGERGHVWSCFWACGRLGEAATVGRAGADGVA